MVRYRCDRAHELWRLMLLIQKPYLLHVLSNCKTCRRTTFERVNIPCAMYCSRVRDISIRRNPHEMMDRLLEQRSKSRFDSIRFGWWTATKKKEKRKEKKRIEMNDWILENWYYFVFMCASWLMDSRVPSPYNSNKCKNFVTRHTSYRRHFALTNLQQNA